MDQLCDEDIERIAKRVFHMVMRRLARAAAIPETANLKKPGTFLSKARLKPTAADFEEARFRLTRMAVARKGKK